MIDQENIHVMAPAEVDEMYKKRYAQICEQAENYYSSHDLSIKGDRKKIIKLIVNMMIISDTFNVNVCNELAALENISTIKELTSIVKKLEQNAQKHKKVLENTISQGIKIRRKEKPYYPPLFNQSSRVYLKTSNGGFLTTLVQSLSASLPIESGLELLEEKEDDRYTFFVKEKGTDKSTKQRLGRFLKQKSDKMTLLLSSYQKADEATKRQFIEKMSATDDYVGFSGGRIQKENGEFEIIKGWFKDFKKQAKFPADLSLDELLFKQIKYAMQKDNITPPPPPANRAI